MYWQSLHCERCFIRKSWRSYRRDRSSRRGCNRWADRGCTNSRADRRRCKENVGRGGQCGRRRSTRHNLRCELKEKKVIFGGRSQPVSHTNSYSISHRERSTGEQLIRATEEGQTVISPNLYIIVYLNLCELQASHHITSIRVTHGGTAATQECRANLLLSRKSALSQKLRKRSANYVLKKL